jgi:hypothetical protein
LRSSPIAKKCSQKVAVKTRIAERETGRTSLPNVIFAATEGAWQDFVVERE